MPTVAACSITLPCSGITYRGVAKKKREVSNMVLRGFRRATILEEIAKCELVCAKLPCCTDVQSFRGVAQPG